MKTSVLAAITPPRAAAYETYFAGRSDLWARVVTSVVMVSETLADRTQSADVLVLDNGLDGAYGLVSQVRQQYPYIIIVLVDEGADFATPGQADDISTEPFANDDLVRRIQRLLADRALVTLRADEMPPVREFAKTLRKAVGELGKQQAAVSACRALGYNYVAYYALNNDGTLSLSVQDGDAILKAAAPLSAEKEDVVSWVARTGQYRIIERQAQLAAPGVRNGNSKSDAPATTMPASDEPHPPTHRLLERGLLTTLACCPVGRTKRYGVLLAGRAGEQPIPQQSILLMELISAQLSAVLSK